MTASKGTPLFDLFSSTATNVNRTKASAILCSSLARQGNPSYRNATDADDPLFLNCDNRKKRCYKPILKGDDYDGNMSLERLLNPFR